MSEQNQQPETEVAQEAPMAQNPYENRGLPKVVCEKHGDVGPHHFTLNAHEFGYKDVHLCLICAFEYASMVCQPVNAVFEDEQTPEQPEGNTNESA
jgi:hypothetical protein